jgi:hypothetical protein
VSDVVGRKRTVVDVHSIAAAAVYYGGINVRGAGHNNNLPVEKEEEQKCVCMCVKINNNPKKETKRWLRWHE